ncbi:tail fiber assembly protein [Pantoea agglomerans]|uniref:tail fiber assembly protein n=1 Tax=Enterobacter agglomerans TaxID=549 RepID=UPI0032094EC1
MFAYALVKEKMVVNTVLWDGETPVDFGDGLVAIQFPEGEVVGIGYSYENGKFAALPPTEEELAARKDAAKSSNINQKDSMMAAASRRISVLQDAVDLEIATDEEAAALPLWKKYRVLLSRIDANKDKDIDWPAKPE